MSANLGVRQPDPEADWPEVTVGGTRKPYVDRSENVEGQLLAPKRPLLFGTVDGIPWSITSFDLGGSGPILEYFLGGMGEFGGGQVFVWLPDGTHLSLTSLTAGGPPKNPVVGYVGFISSDVEEVLVRLADGRERTVDIYAPVAGGLRSFVFFPPYGAAGVAQAMSSSGLLFAERSLYETLIEPNAFASTGSGWPRT